ncbi:MAG TPA: tetratricopeptide repeat protein [Verrucomicrobiae bacterium]|nr:tetratricopeptide repeat protein [Verrucomicrobiae bacterium]
MAEKTSSNIDPRANGFYQKALAALERNNLDYAIEMLIQTLNIEPNFTKAREYLRAVQMKKTESAGGLKRMFTGAKLTPLLTKAKMAVQKNPSEAMTLAEQALTEDPKNSQALWVLAEAAEVAKLPETVVQTLETYTRLNPKDTKALHWLARSYKETGQHAQAGETYDRLLQINPNDFEAQKGAKDSTADGAMAGGGWEESTTSFRDKLKDKDESIALEQQSRMVRAEDMLENLIKEKLEALAKEPESSVIQRELGKLYVQRDNYDEALRYLEGLYAKEGGQDPSLEKEIGDTKIKRLEFKITGQKKELAQKPGDPALTSEIAALEAELDQLKLGEAQRLVERYPNDLMYRYELGTLYIKIGNIEGAVEQLQKSRNQPQRRVASLNQLGQCYQQMGLPDMAIDTYNEAITELPVMDGLKKDLLYNLGNAYELMGDQEKALAAYKEIAKVDFSYRDVREKIMRRPPPKQ